MRSRKDLSLLSALAERIRNNPRQDLDDDLFYTISRAAWLGKEVRIVGTVAEDHGKQYLRLSLRPGEGEWVSIRRLLLDFADRYVLLDGFLLEDIIIEKGFVEELLSAVDGSVMTAVADDISSFETEAAAVSDEALPLYPGIQQWNADAVLSVPRVRYGNGENAKERLASAYRNVLEKAAAGNYRTLSIAPLSDYPLSLEGDVASSAVSIFFALRPDAPMSVTFVLPDHHSLSLFLGATEHQEE